MESKRLKPLKVEATANGSKRLIDALEVSTTNSKFISLSSPVQRAALKTLQDIIPLALVCQPKHLPFQRWQQKIDPCS